MHGEEVSFLFLKLASITSCKFNIHWYFYWSFRKVVFGPVQTRVAGMKTSFEARGTSFKSFRAYSTTSCRIFQNKDA